MLITDKELIAILRGIPEEKLLAPAEALYAGGIRLLEVTFSPDGSRRYRSHEYGQ